MKARNKYLLLTLLAFLLCSCDQALLPSDYIKWVKDPAHGLVQTKEIGGLKLEAIYKPTAYLIANEEKTNKIPEKLYKERAAIVDKQQQYELKFFITERDGVNLVNWRVASTKASEERMQYLSFEMQKHIYLIDGTDTLPCILYHFERSYDVAPYRRFLVGFDNKNSGKDKTLVFDSPVFGTGPMKIRFEQQAISNIPSIKLIP